MNVNKQLKKLENILSKMNSVLVAYSGGADSSFLLKTAKDVLGNKAMAVTEKSEVFPLKELIEAKKTAEKIGVKHLVINSNKLKIKNFKENSKNRCYYCKKELFSKLKKIANKYKIDYLIDGSNYDDLKDYRPGANALKELKIRSPLQEAKITKKEILILSKRLKLPTYNKPSFACLASRFPYRTKITKKRLRKIQYAEEFLKKLNIRHLRVRYHDTIARIETDKKDFLKLIKNKAKIINKFKKIGFNYITLDLEGYRTGSINEVLR